MPLDNGGPPPRPGGPTGPGANKTPMKKSTRNWLIGGIVVGGAVVVYFVVKARSNAASQSAATDPNAVDPNTGLTYAQEAAGAGYGGYGASGTTPSLYGYVDPTTGQFISGAGATSPGNSILTPSTNAEWAQQVEAYLQGLGYDPMTVAAALGKYLTGQTLTSDQQGIVAAAQGFFGVPPTTPPPAPTTTPGGQNGGGGKTGHFRLSQAGFSGTLADIGRRRHWSEKYLDAVEKLMGLTDTSRIQKGEELILPTNVPVKGGPGIPPIFQSKPNKPR